MFASRNGKLIPGHFGSTFRILVTPESSIPQQLCTDCGLCCNGVIFRDVELGASDLSRLEALGLPVRRTSKKAVMNQPCAALDCRNLCKIYTERPGYCREFECALLKSTVAGETTIPAAVKTIRLARKRAEKVKNLLRELGNDEEQLALSKRFKKVARAFDRGELPDESSGLYGDLTMAVHELNYLLSTDFYPGS